MFIKSLKVLVSIAMVAMYIQPRADIILEIEKDIVAMASVSDMNGNLFPEIALLRISSGGVPNIIFKDSITNEFIKKIKFLEDVNLNDKLQEPKELTNLGDINGNGSDELAVLIRGEKTGNHKVVIVDSFSGEVDNIVPFGLDPNGEINIVQTDTTEIIINADDNTFSLRYTVNNPSSGHLEYDAPPNVPPDLPFLVVTPAGPGVILSGESKTFTFTGSLDAIFAPNSPSAALTLNAREPLNGTDLYLEQDLDLEDICDVLLGDPSPIDITKNPSNIIAQEGPILVAIIGAGVGAVGAWILKEYFSSDPEPTVIINIDMSKTYNINVQNNNQETIEFHTCGTND